MGDAGGQGINIVIFEGGLAGGLSSLVLFQELMARARVVGGSLDIRRLCKVVAGTGTGALIACMLVLLGMDIDQATAAYLRLVESVFSDKKMITTTGSGTFKASKLEEELKRIVWEAMGDENAPMMKAQQSDDDCKVMAFAMSEYNMNGSIPRIFRSYQGRSNQMPNCPIWQVLRATMAHPELFKSFEVEETSMITESLVGGDIACSNPTPHVLAEVSALYPEGHIASIDHADERASGDEERSDGQRASGAGDGDAVPGHIERVLPVQRRSRDARRADESLAEEG
ncbi:hypothetical protein FRC07_007995 [Ceratobasidium sp. 392]|nr:hypothetical protein FRC07_007995 [Ceratobasidium sp. 392]